MLVKPIMDSLCLGLIMHTPGKGFVFVAGTNETGIELDGIHSEGLHVGDEVFRYTATTEDTSGIWPFET